MRNFSYRFPLILAITLHILLFLTLFVHFTSSDTHNLQLQPDVDIIKAEAVNPADVAVQITQIHAQEQQKQREAQQEALKLQQEQQQQREQAQAAQRQKEAETAAQQKTAQQAQKQAQQKAEAAALLEQQQAEQKVLQQKQMQQTAVQKQQTESAAETKKVAEEKTKEEAIKKQQQAKKDVEKKQQKAAQELKLAQQKALQNQIAAEQKQLEAARTNQQQSEIDKFTALILHTMRQNWIVPEGINPTISCQLAIRLNADGTVLSVTLLRSSGNAALDNSARLAVFKSSPLPVPADSDLFKQVFRQFNLTVSPKDVQ